LNLVNKKKIIYQELGKFQPVQRDLAIIVDKSLPFSDLENAIKKLNLPKLQEIRFFMYSKAISLVQTKNHLL